MLLGGGKTKATTRLRGGGKTKATTCTARCCLLLPLVETDDVARAVSDRGERTAQCLASRKSERKR
eukprot:760962-Hanusia_phi.AAC.4